MNPLQQALNDYLSIRRSLGFRLREPENYLRNFVAFFQDEGAPLHDHGTRASLGHPAHKGSTFHLGSAFGCGPTLCLLVQRQRTSY